LLVCSAAFNPRDSFHDFNVDGLINLAKLYPADFDHVELRDLNAELFLYIDDVRQDDRFANIHTIVELSQKNGTDKDTSYLSFGLSAFEVSTCIAYSHSYSERIFSAMKIVKTELRNRIGDIYI